MGFGANDYFARQHEKRKVEWSKERAWHEGWLAGHRQGTEEMKAAYGTSVAQRDEVATEGEETKVEGEGLPTEREPDGVRVGKSTRVPCEGRDCIHFRKGEGHRYCHIHECSVEGCYAFYRECEDHYPRTTGRYGGT